MIGVHRYFHSFQSLSGVTDDYPMRRTPLPHERFFAERL